MIFTYGAAASSCTQIKVLFGSKISRKNPHVGLKYSNFLKNNTKRNSFFNFLINFA